MRRLLPALGLFFLAPLIAEFLLGNLPITMLGSLVVLAPLYGGGALLIREVARRTGRGWASIVVLALAYGIQSQLSGLESAPTGFRLLASVRNRRLVDRFRAHVAYGLERFCFRRTGGGPGAGACD